MARRVVVVLVEGVGINMLGAYGGPWLPTPTLNATSIRSDVFDRFWLDSLSLERLYRSMWCGLHAGEPDGALATPLPTWLQDSGLGTFLATDSDEVLALPSSNEFESVARIDVADGDEVSRWEDAGIARFFEESITAWLAVEPAPSLVWLHSRGLRGPWDAPYELRKLQQGEDDPPPPRGTTPPNANFQDRHEHADELLGWNQAASAQVHLLDEAWDWFVSAVEEQSKQDEYLVMFLGLQGYPLGEHGVVGLEQETVFAERTRCPFWIWKPESPLGRRLDFFVQPSHLFQTILDWLQIRSPEAAVRPCSSNILCINASRPWNEIPVSHQSALTFADRAWSCQTPWWSGISSSDSEQPRELADERETKLFVLPDDRFQQNNVFRRARQIAESLEAYRSLLIDWMCQVGDRGPMPCMPDRLLERPR